MRTSEVQLFDSPLQSARHDLMPQSVGVSIYRDHRLAGRQRRRGKIVQDVHYNSAALARQNCRDLGVDSFEFLGIVSESLVHVTGTIRKQRQYERNLMLAADVVE